MDFQVGDMVKCIDAYLVLRESASRKTDSLALGKEYKVLAVHPSHITVVDEFGKPWEFFKERFSKDGPIAKIEVLY